jgi:hypothetical protein
MPVLSQLASSRVSAVALPSLRRLLLLDPCRGIVLRRIGGFMPSGAVQGGARLLVNDETPILAVFLRNVVPHDFTS